MDLTHTKLKDFFNNYSGRLYSDLTDAANAAQENGQPDVKKWFLNLRDYASTVISDELNIIQNPSFIHFRDKQSIYLPYQRGYQSFNDTEITEFFYQLWRLDSQQLITHVQATRNYKAMFRHHIPLPVITDKAIHAFWTSQNQQKKITIERLNFLVLDALENELNNLRKISSNLKDINLYPQYETQELQVTCISKNQQRNLCEFNVGAILDIQIIELRKPAQTSDYCEWNDTYGKTIDSKSIWVTPECSGQFKVIYTEEPHNLPLAFSVNDAVFGAFGLLPIKMISKVERLKNEHYNYLKANLISDLKIIKKEKKSKSISFEALNNIRFRHSMYLSAKLKVKNKNYFESIHKRIEKLKKHAPDKAEIIEKIYQALENIELLRYSVHKRYFQNNIGIDYRASFTEALNHADSLKQINNKLLKKMWLAASKLNEHLSCNLDYLTTNCNLNLAQNDIEFFEMSFKDFFSKQEFHIYYKSTLTHPEVLNVSWSNHLDAKVNQLKWISI